MLCYTILHYVFLGGCLLQSVKDAAGEEGEDVDEEEADPDDARYACLNNIPTVMRTGQGFLLHVPVFHVVGYGPLRNSEQADIP